MSDDTMLRPPAHPGVILREDVLPAMEVTQQQLADALRLSRQTVNAILSARSPITAETAVKLGTLLGNSPQFWMNLQSAYDLWYARQQMDVSVLQELGNLHQWYAGDRL